MIDFNDKNLKLKKELSKMLPYDIANTMQDLEMIYQYKIMKTLPKSKMCKVFTLLENNLQEEYFISLSKKDKMFLLNNLEIDDLKEFISKFDIKKQEELLNFLTHSKYLDTKKLLIYDKEEAASIMTLSYVKIDINMSIKEATKHVFTNVNETDFIDILYVFDQKKLVGVIKLKDLIVARKTEVLQDLIIDNYHYVSYDETIEQAIKKIKSYDLQAIPVLDYENNMLGIITADDVLDELVQRREEEYKNLARLKYSNIDDRPFKRTLSRLPWLVLAMVVNLLIARFNTIFETAIEQIAVLIIFQALVLSMAGNIGTQAMGVTIIKISRGDFEDKKSKNALKHIFKETLIALINSTIVALIASFYVFIFLTIFPSKPEQYNNSPILISLIVLISMLVSMIISAIAGVIMPIIAYRLKLDPGNITGPILTTINDFFALATYFLTATLFIYLSIIKIGG